jgi:hypothetical protein
VPLIGHVVEASIIAVCISFLMSLHVCQTTKRSPPSEHYLTLTYLRYSMVICVFPVLADTAMKYNTPLFHLFHSLADCQHWSIDLPVSYLERIGFEKVWGSMLKFQMLNVVCETDNGILSLFQVVLQAGHMKNHTDVSAWTGCFLFFIYYFVMCFITVKSVKQWLL